MDRAHFVYTFTSLWTFRFPVWGNYEKWTWRIFETQLGALLLKKRHDSGPEIYIIFKDNVSN